jgi:hypothetical protein
MILALTHSQSVALSVSMSVALAYCVGFVTAVIARRYWG